MHPVYPFRVKITDYSYTIITVLYTGKYCAQVRIVYEGILPFRFTTLPFCYFEYIIIFNIILYYDKNQWNRNPVEIRADAITAVYNSHGIIFACIWLGDYNNMYTV